MISDKNVSAMFMLFYNTEWHAGNIVGSHQVFFEGMGKREWERKDGRKEARKEERKDRKM